METINILVYTIVSVIAIVYGYFRYKFSYWNKRGVLHDPPSFPLGNLRGVGKKFHISELAQRYYNEFKNKDKMIGMYFFAKPAVLAIDVELVKNVLIKDFHNFNDRGLYYNEKDDPLSAHLFSLEGEKWKPLRAKLSPTFTSGKMKFMFSTIIEVADRFRGCMKYTIVKEGENIEIRDILARFTTDVIGSCAFGIECNSLNNPKSEFREKGRDVFEKPRHSPNIFTIFMLFKELSKKIGIKVLPDYISDFFMSTVKKNIDYRRANKVKRNDFMDMLIKLQDNGMLTTDEIAAQAFIFFLAGFETSSTTMSYCMYELSQLPEVQQKIRQNVRDVLNKHNGEMTYEAIMEMNLVEQAINETLRKYPPVAILSRLTQNDYKVPETNHHIDKGTFVFIPVLAIHRDPEFYPEPDKFKIERFTPDEIAKRGQGKWLPFGDGPRNCIGLRFGMMQARIGLAMLLDNFEFTLNKQTPVPLKFIPDSFILTAESPMYLNMKILK